MQARQVFFYIVSIFARFCEFRFYKCRVQSHIPLPINCVFILRKYIFHSNISFQWALIFGEHSLLEAFNDATITEIATDATFSTTPLPFYQHYLVMAVVDGHGIPFLHALMSRKTERLYKSIILKLSEVCPLLDPSKVMMDYEVAMGNAWRAVFPGMQVVGCR